MRASLTDATFRIRGYPSPTGGSGLAPTSRDRDLARAHHLDHPERADHLLEGVDLVGRARDLHDQRLAGDVDDLAAEDLDRLEHLGALTAVGGDLEQRQLAGDRALGLEVADLDHVDELVQLLGDLVDRVQRAVERQRDARDVVVVRRADGERVDVEAASREESRDAGQDTWLVLDEDRQRVLAPRAQAHDRIELLEAQRFLGPGLAHDGHPTMSRAAWPGAIIGYTFSSRVTRTSTTTGPSVASAVLTSSTSVVLSVKRMPVQPYASASLTKSGNCPMSTCE